MYHRIKLRSSRAKYAGDLSISLWGPALDAWEALDLTGREIPGPEPRSTNFILCHLTP